VGSNPQSKWTAISVLLDAHSRSEQMIQDDDMPLDRDPVDASIVLPPLGFGFVTISDSPW